MHRLLQQHEASHFTYIRYLCSRSQWPCGLRRRSAAARLPRSWVRIPPGTRMFVCCECCVLSGRGLCNELITRPEESYRLWWINVCDLETSRTRRPWPAWGRSVTQERKKEKSIYVFPVIFRINANCSPNGLNKQVLVTEMQCVLCEAAT